MTHTVKRLSVFVIIVLFVVTIILSMFLLPPKVYADAIPAVGNSYGGGTVAYILQSGDPGYEEGKVKGIIAATSDQSMGRWVLSSFYYTSVSGTSRDLWTGSGNTDKIIAQNGPGSYAASIARAYNSGGYSDWHLPSYHELTKLFSSGILTGYAAYWSSSEYDNNRALAYAITGPGALWKHEIQRVRAVRYFTIDIAPPEGNITINSGAEYTNSNIITLNLHATDNVGVTGYRAADGTDAFGEPTTEVSSTTSFSESVSWTLPAGDGQKTIAVQYRDEAGNWSPDYIDSIVLDQTGPDITITKPAGGATYLLNQVIDAEWTATDATSGLASATGTVESGLPFDTGSVGTKTFTVNAEDNAGNQVTETVTYNVCYDFIGFLQPINNDGSSIFKLKSTIPVKFQLKDAYGNYIKDAVAKIFIRKISDSLIGDIEEAVSTGSATTGNLFRYDSTSEQYIFNLGTKTLTSGTWQIIIRLDGYKEYSVEVGLR